MKILKLMAVSFVLLMTITIVNSEAVAQERPKDPKSDPADIIGYRYDKDWWVLGANIDDMDLRGFRPEETHHSSIQVFDDYDRALRFGSRERKFSVSLVFVNDILAAQILRVMDMETSYAFTRDYFEKIYTKCEVVLDTHSKLCFRDSDNDLLMVENQPYWLGCPSIGPDPVIIYLRRDLIQPDPLENLPQWFEWVREGIGVKGPEYY